MNPAPGSDGRKKPTNHQNGLRKRNPSQWRPLAKAATNAPQTVSAVFPARTSSAPAPAAAALLRAASPPTGTTHGGEETEPRAVPRARATHPSRAAPATAVGWPGSGIREGCRGSRPEATDVRLTPLPPLAVASEHLLLRTPR